MGLETIKLIEESDFAIAVPKKGEYFVSCLRQLVKKYPQLGHVGGLGLAIRIKNMSERRLYPQ